MSVVGSSLLKNTERYSSSPQTIGLTMSVLKQILDWSVNRPSWQRDALRRLVQNGQLADADFEELGLMLQSAKGITVASSTPVAQPLDASHLAISSTGDPTVVLESLRDLVNVNALSEQQSLSFSISGLTVVYGDNGAGKSGYVRFLKRLCRARAPGDNIRRNVFSNRTDVPSGTVTFYVGTDRRELVWSDGEVGPPELGAVSVFDTACASVYVEKKTPVAYRPLGLDLLSKLAVSCDRVEIVLQRAIERSDAGKLTFATYSPGQPVSVLLNSLSPATTTQMIDSLATLTAIEKQRANELRVQIAELNLDGHRKKSQELRNRATRLRALSKELFAMEHGLSVEVEHSLRDALDQTRVTKEAVKLASALRFADQPLPSVGSTVWKALWDAARAYSVNEAYKDSSFPNASAEALCVLCQQPLEGPARERLIAFEQFVHDKSQAAADAASSKLAQLNLGVERTKVAVSSEALLEDLNANIAPTRSAVEAFVALASQRKTAIQQSVTDGAWVVPLELTASPTVELEQLAQLADEEAVAADAAANPEEMDKLQSELLLLDERARLFLERDQVLTEVERLAHRAKLSACLSDTETNAITRKSTELTKSSVSDALCSRFEYELRGLGLSHLSVVLDATGGAKGTLYHKVEIRRGDGTGISGVEHVLSEGEQRCIALAAFLAELSTQSSNSTIVFDDPVSSLDHERRETIVRRLVHESKSRPVVVFTHDLVFLLSMERRAAVEGTTFNGRQLRRSVTAIGKVAGDLPWYGLSVKKRIGYLRDSQVRAAKLYKEEEVDEYRDRVLNLYGLLRETWERAVEEVWLNEAIVRFGREVQTQRLKKILDVNAEDYQGLESGMDRCSTFNAGHDAPPAVNLAVPEPHEVLTDIVALEGWVETIRKRRK